MCVVNSAPPPPKDHSGDGGAEFTLAAPVSRAQGQYSTYYPYGQNFGYGQQHGTCERFRSETARLAFLTSSCAAL